MSLIHFYRKPALSSAKKNELLSAAKRSVSGSIEDIETEYCFNVEIAARLNDEETGILRWLLSETFEHDNFSSQSFLVNSSPVMSYPLIVEVGPRLNFSTAWSTNAVSVCHACGLTKVRRIERSRRYGLIIRRGPTSETSTDQEGKNFSLLDPLGLESFPALVHDRMTECVYPHRLTSFETGIAPEPVHIVPLIEEGRKALMKINVEMGLGLDEWDIEYYYNLFVNDIGRDPTNVECFDLGQSNSEHSRHWFFRGRLVIDGKVIPHTLMDIIKAPLKKHPKNSIIAFKDNFSAIQGYEITTIVPETPGLPSRCQEKSILYHAIFTAETHNFPTGVAPFPGAETGTGGRIRDVHATGRG
ncbi:MAG TPA: phosphoribosylformylglycinamidine synthase, partial [Thermodesulfovibrionales bacterium]|nr:phosphoribosylformylglycinamidine synthase [Thermodesulfovibrionales bacterium]